MRFEELCDEQERSLSDPRDTLTTPVDGSIGGGDLRHKAVIGITVHYMPWCPQTRFEELRDEQERSLADYKSIKNDIESLRLEPLATLVSGSTEGNKTENAICFVSGRFHLRLIKVERY